MAVTNWPTSRVGAAACSTSRKVTEQIPTVATSGFPDVAGFGSYVWSGERILKRPAKTMAKPTAQDAGDRYGCHWIEGVAVI